MMIGSAHVILIDQEKIQSELHITKTFKMSNRTSTPDLKISEKDSIRLNSASPSLCNGDFGYCNSSVEVSSLFNSLLLF